MASGIKVNEAVKAMYENDIKCESKQKYKYLFAQINKNAAGKEEIGFAKAKEGEEFGGEDYAYGNDITTLDQLRERMERSFSGSCVYVVFDYHYTKGGLEQQKVPILIKFCDELAIVKAKMVYASSWSEFRLAMKGHKSNYELCEIEEICDKEILKKLLK